MRQEITAEHRNDDEGNPAGGLTTGTGIKINWQDGPLGRDADRQEPNGAFVEGVIAAAIDRLEWYQSSQFKCAANEDALYHLEKALEDLDARTQEREKREVEGTHTV